MKRRLFSVLLAAAAMALGACGSKTQATQAISAAKLAEMDGFAIDREAKGAAVHIVLSVPSEDCLRKITLVPDAEKAGQLGLAMSEDGHVDFEHYMVMRGGTWQDAVPPNCMFEGDGEKTRQFGYLSDIQAEGVEAVPKEAAEETEVFMEELTGRSFQAFRVVTSNPMQPGGTGEYWVWLMLNLHGIPVLESGTVGAVAKYSPQGVYAYYGRFLFREETEEAFDSYADPEEIVDRFLAGQFGLCEKCELVYVCDPAAGEDEKVLIPAWVFYVQEDDGLKAYEYSAADGGLIDVCDLAFLW